MKLVAYYRVSTTRQGQSGLGLDAQRAAVNQFAVQSSGAIIAEYTEVESGKCADRPQLALALAQANLTGATLVVAKLDRLARNVAFLSAIMDSGANFVACDNPHANRLTLHILAAVAEAEATAISQRTKAALAQAKARGIRLGGANPRCRNLTEESRGIGALLGGTATREACEEFRAAILPVAKAIAGTATEIAIELNKRGYTTKQGLPWTRRTVQALLRTKHD